MSLIWLGSRNAKERGCPAAEGARRCHQGDRRHVAVSVRLDRNEASEESDLDLFVDYDKDGDFSAIELVRLKNYIRDALEIEVDVTTRDGLHPLIRDEVVAKAEQVF
jgi:predicted nucleotidyltransferase